MQKNLQNKHGLECFLQGEKSITVPFDIECSDFKYKCTNVLRLLPFKRVVLEANNIDQHVVIKLFASARNGFRNLKQEKKGHELACAADITVPELLLSSDKIDGCFAIVYEYIKNTEHFSLGLESTHFDRITNLYQFLAKMHSYGIYQDDIHQGNFLLKNEKLYLIDLGSISCERQGIPLSIDKSLANIAKLIVQFYFFEQNILIQRVNLYFQERKWQFTEKQQAHFFLLLDKAWKKRKNEYINKCYRSCTMTSYQHSFSYESAFRTHFIESFSRNIHNNIDQIMENGNILKAGNSATVVKINIDGFNLVIKRYNIKNFSHLLRRFWRPSRASVSWRNANLLELIGIKTPKPIGFIEKRFGPFRSVAYFISEYQEADSLLSTYSKRAPLEKELTQISNLFKTLNKFKISHGDFKASNLLINSSGEISLIDLDSMHEHVSHALFQRAHNKDKNRFLRNWGDKTTQDTLKNIIF